MKKLLIALLAIFLLVPAAMAQAYAIYNHVDYKVCVQTPASQFFLICTFRIGPNGTHNGAHGSGLKNHMVTWKGDGRCWISDEFSIPDGGYARIYKHEVKIYKHDGNHVSTKAVRWMYVSDCPGPIPGKNKP
jgi:hypothetical protein